MKGNFFSFEKPVELLSHLLILIVKTLEQSVVSLKQQPQVRDLLQGFSGLRVGCGARGGVWEVSGKAGQGEGCAVWVPLSLCSGRVP